MTKSTAGFGDFLKGEGVSFSFKSFGGQGGIRFESRPGSGISFEELLRQAGKAPASRRDTRYELQISQAEARHGTKKILARKGKKLEVKIPAGVRTGTEVRLKNARRITDGESGDIIIQVKVQ